ncbi:MAG: hypothetical protein K0R38_6552 [Polyangiaceae bacterium]|jgi:hypothetical protein|nr:hypothetical protein [Polyangiaceae bacterium]
MARHVSGVFFKTDRAPVTPGTMVRLLGADHKQLGRAALIELGASTLRLTSPRPPELGTKVLVAITLPGRYIEFEVPGVVDWELDCHFGVSLDYLTARQAYALALARDLLRTAPSETVAAPRRAARR